MIEYVFYALCGKRRHVEELRNAVGLTQPIVEMPGGSTLDFELPVGTPQQAKAEELIKKHKLDPFRRRRVEATPEELGTAELFSNVGCSWVVGREGIIDPPKHSGSGVCPACGKGGREHDDAVQGKFATLRKYHLIRTPPALLFGSSRLLELIHREKWTGVQSRTVVEKPIGKRSDLFEELWITSVLPPMHSSGGPERSPIPDSCEKCKKLGYQLRGRQLIYPKAVIAAAADWNLSREWTAPHYVSCPDLICSQRVVHELLKLEPTQKWIPVKLVDD